MTRIGRIPPARRGFWQRKKYEQFERFLAEGSRVDNFRETVKTVLYNYHHKEEVARDKRRKLIAFFRNLGQRRRKSKKYRRRKIN